MILSVLLEPDSRTAVRLKISFKRRKKKKKQKEEEEEEEARDLTGGDISREFNHQGFERLKQWLWLRGHS